MILVLAAYFGMAYYLLDKMIKTAKHFDDLETSSTNEKEPEYKFNIDLNVGIKTDNVLYKEFINIVNNNNLDTNKKILVCCTGDYQSMALLAIAFQVFGKDNINVFFHNYDETYIIQLFLLNICEYNNIKFHCFENNDDSRNNRYNKIDNLCKEFEIDYVFEAHNLINNSNEILANIFNNTVEEKPLINTYKPFINIDNITLYKFFSTYDIIIDTEFTHLEHTRMQYKTVFEDVEQIITNYYPDWRINVIEHFNNVNFSTDLNILKGSNGFLLALDTNTISYFSFKKSINKIFDEFGFTSDDMEEYYNDNEKEIFFISNEYENKINDLIDYLDNTDLESLIGDLLENTSDSSFEHLEQSMINELENMDKDETKKTEESEKKKDENIENSEDVEDSEDIENSEDFEDSEDIENSEDIEEVDEKEYIVKVDFSYEYPKMKIVNKIDNFSEDYINGIIYVNICNNTYYIYDSDCVCDDKKNQ